MSNALQPTPGGRKRKRDGCEEPRVAKKSLLSSPAIDSTSASTESPIKLFATTLDEQERHLHKDDNQHWSFTQCWTLREMLGFDDNSGDDRCVEWMVIGNYIVDFEYLIDEVPEILSLPKTLIIYGVNDTSEEPLRQACTLNGTCSIDFLRRNPSDPPLGPANPLRQRIPYGVHHSKFFLIGYSTGTLRVVIHTANLRYSDIHNKAQGAYIQDFPSKMTASPQERPMTTQFQADLISYINTYGFEKPHVWSPSQEPNLKRTLSDQLLTYDFREAKVLLIPSTPGYHNVSDCRVGHLNLRRAVRSTASSSIQESQHVDQKSALSSHGSSIICQFSSIGSLSAPYVKELQRSMNASEPNKREMATGEKKMLLKLVYPTTDEICDSVEGYRGGGSVPGNSRNVFKPFLQPLFHKWSSGMVCGASTSALSKATNVPHIKTYYQLDNDHESMLWFVLTSHNLSKAAWGEVQDCRYGRRLFVRHWELGVFLAPSHFGARRLLPWSEGVSNDILTVPLPYNLNPEKYKTTDKPWTVDTRNSRSDIFGRYALTDP